jgi:hypothetical protein
MKTYIVLYNYWDTMGIYYAGSNPDKAEEVLIDKVGQYGKVPMYLQTWENGALISEKNAKEVLK